MMRLALLLPLAYAAEDDHIKPAEFLTKWGTDTLPEDATISTQALAEGRFAWVQHELSALQTLLHAAGLRAQARSWRPPLGWLTPSSSATGPAM